MTPREFTLREFFKEIEGFNYVVQRNWENLPYDYEVAGHQDLDLFATDEDKKKIEKILEKYPEIPCDVRSPEDDYYPHDLNVLLLESRHGMGGVWIPSPLAGFLALYYHNLVHKQGSPYEEKLGKMFKQMFPPVKCKDNGVGFYGNN